MVHYHWPVEIVRAHFVLQVLNSKSLESFLKILNRTVVIFQLFKQGRSKKIKNMLHGESSDVEVGIFDYQYTVGTGKNFRRYKQTVVYFQSAAIDCPDFALRPKNFFHKNGNLFGYQDIDFESHLKFSSSYILRGTSEYRIRKVFTETLLSFFEGQPGLCVEGQGSRLIFYRTSKRIKPEDVRSFLNEGFQVYRLFKKSA
jgi:carbonic anhydrase